MSATLDKSVDHFGKTFCLVISWLEAIANPEECFVWEADCESGRLVLMGETERCQEFQQLAGDIIANCEDPADYWR